MDNVIKDVLIKTSNKFNADSPLADKPTYIRDSLYFCDVCKSPLQTKINLQGKEYTVRVMCKCEEKEYEAEQEAFKKQQRELQTKINKQNGLIVKEWKHCTFANDDGKTPKLIAIAKRYVTQWDKIKAENIGLLFFGGVGIGKTYATLCIANALLDAGERVIVTNFSRIINDLSNFDNDKNDYIHNLASCSLLVIDDLGAERQSDYALQIVESVIDERYKANKPIILTTNLSMAELQNPKDLKYARIYSRILSMTSPVKAQGEDRRKEEHSQKLELIKEIFKDGV